VDETIINDSPQLMRNYSDAIGNESTAHCVTLGLNKGRAQLSLAACSEKQPYMCQVYMEIARNHSGSLMFLQPKCETGTCLSNCVKNVFTFNIIQMSNFVMIFDLRVEVLKKSYFEPSRVMFFFISHAVGKSIGS
jgi:virulence-associated protein VapD